MAEMIGSYAGLGWEESRMDILGLFRIEWRWRITCHCLQVQKSTSGLSLGAWQYEMNGSSVCAWRARDAPGISGLLEVLICLDSRSTTIIGGAMVDWWSPHGGLWVDAAHPQKGPQVTALRWRSSQKILVPLICSRTKWSPFEPLWEARDLTWFNWFNR
jgi:hypothetical protein